MHTHKNTYTYIYTHIAYIDRVERDSAVAIATRYEDRIQVGAIFPAPVQTGRVTHPAPYAMGTASFLGVKRPRGGIHHPPPSGAEVKERADLNLYSPSESSWPVLG
jgi:hypothetical protein